MRGECKADSIVVHNGVDLSEFTPDGPGDKPHDFYRILLVEGNLGGGYEQGLVTAVEMVRLLNRRLEKPTHLMVVGKVPSELKESLSSEDVTIEWKGLVRREDIPEIDRSAHLLFSSDVNAACPNSVIEAMACGLPVIGYDTGALKELIAAGTGEIAPYGSDVWQLKKPDVHALADAAQKVLQAQEDYAKRAREYARAHFDIQKIADCYLEMLIANL